MGALDAKAMIEEGWVTVNGRVETQPGRATAAGRSARVVTTDRGGEAR